MKDKIKVEVFNSKKHILAEGPFYDARYKVISWIDIVDQKLFLLDNHNKLKEIKFNEKIGAAIPLKRSNGYLVCGEKHLFVYENNEIKELESLDSIMEEGMRCNDAKADPFGRLWFSSMVDDGLHAPSGALYCYCNKEIICMQEDMKLGNGMAWNSKGDKFFYADSVERKIYSYDYDLDTGYISNRKELCTITDGVPDGMTIDKDDNLFIAIWGGARVEERSCRTGILKRVIDIPTNLVTSCAFINDNYDTLLVTTASIEQTDNHAGNIFKVTLNTKGKQIDYVKID